jgi:hypothetical protein
MKDPRIIVNKNLLNSFLDLECPWHEKRLEIDDQDNLKCKYCEDVGWENPWAPSRFDLYWIDDTDKGFLYRLTKIKEYYDQQKTI